MRSDQSSSPKHSAKNPGNYACSGERKAGLDTPLHPLTSAVGVFAPVGGYSTAPVPVKAKVNRPAPYGGGPGLDWSWAVE